MAEVTVESTLDEAREARKRGFSVPARRLCLGHDGWCMIQEWDPEAGGWTEVGGPVELSSLAETERAELRRIGSLLLR